MKKTNNAAAETQVVTAAEITTKVSKVIPTKAKLAFLEPLIEAGEMDAKELAAAFVAAYPAMSAATIGTWITDQKNPKYSKTKALVVKKENGKLGFAA